MNLVMIDLKGKHSIQRQVVHKHTYSNIDTQAHRQTSYIYIYTYIYILYRRHTFIDTTHTGAGRFGNGFCVCILAAR